MLFPAVADHHLQFRLMDPRHGVVLADDIQVHLLELRKFRRTERDLASSLDRWLFFLRHAEFLDAEALPPGLTGPAIQRAVKELGMITQNDLERELYEAREKQRRDEVSRLSAAKRTGVEQGIRQGAIAQVHFCQQLLKRDLTPAEQLSAMPIEELQSLVKRLQNDVLSLQ